MQYFINNVNFNTETCELQNCWLDTLRAKLATVMAVGNAVNNATSCTLLLLPVGFYRKLYTCMTRC